MQGLIEHVDVRKAEATVPSDKTRIHAQIVQWGAAWGGALEAPAFQRVNAEVRQLIREAFDIASPGLLPLQVIVMTYGCTACGEPLL